MVQKHWIATIYFFISDINECLFNNGGCEQTCADSVGSFNCSCEAGYQLSSDSTSCQGNVNLVHILTNQLQQLLSQID